MGNMFFLQPNFTTMFPLKLPTKTENIWYQGKVTYVLHDTLWIVSAEKNKHFISKSFAGNVSFLPNRHI